MPSFRSIRTQVTANPLAALRTLRRRASHLALLLQIFAGLCGLTTLVASAATALQPSATNATPPVQKLNDHTFRVGQVTLDTRQRSVRFPAAVNLRDGVVEYAVVTTRGKIHESVFRTTVDPQDIHLAMLLLNARPANTNAFPDDLSLPPPGERIRLDVSWKQNRRLIRRRLKECIRSTSTHKALAEGPWIYNGSFVDHGRFAARLGGSIVAIQIDPSALVNNPRPGREDDTLHFSNRKYLPPENTLVEITFTLTPRDHSAISTPARASESLKPELPTNR